MAIFDDLIVQLGVPAHIFRGNGMTEQEWLVYDNPQKMLGEISALYNSGWQVTDRKLRLFAAACYRLVTVDYIAGVAQRAGDDAEHWAESGNPPPDQHNIRNAAAINFANPAVHAESACSWAEYHGKFAHQKSAIIRCIVGNPFSDVAHNLTHLTQPIEGKVYRFTSPRLRKWLTPTVLAVASSIYDERRWGDMPILGDALEEAGCDNEEMLAHCRSTEPHVRGCWVVDLLLGKE